MSVAYTICVILDRLPRVAALGHSQQRAGGASKGGIAVPAQHAVRQRHDRCITCGLIHGRFEQYSCHRAVPVPALHAICQRHDCRVACRHNNDIYGKADQEKGVLLRCQPSMQFAIAMQNQAQ